MKMYIFMDPQAKVDEIKTACEKACSERYEVICVPEWLVSTAADALNEKKTEVATIIGLPGGTTSPFAKFAEAKQALANGADWIIFPVNMQFCIDKNISAAKGELKEVLVATKTKLAQSKKVKAAALIDGAKIDTEILKDIVSACISTNVDKIFVAHSDAIENIIEEFPIAEKF